MPDEPIDIKKTYGLRGSTLKALLEREVKGVQGELDQQIDKDGNTTLGIAAAAKNRFWVVMNGDLAEYELFGRPV